MKHLMSFILIIFLFVSGCYKNKEESNIPGETKASDMNTLVQKDNSGITKESAPPKNTTLNQLTSDKIGTQSSINDNINTQNTSVKRMVIRTGTMSLEVETYDDIEKKIQETAGKFGGYISVSSSTLNSAGKKQGSITLKVPYDKFDMMLSEISSFGKVASKNISTSDVTEEYIDLESRVKTQKELEQRLLKLLQEKAARLSDVIEVEQKLADVRRQIESIEGKMKYLSSRSEFSTLTISIYEPAMLQTSSGGGFFYEMGRAVKNGIKGFTEIFSGIIVVFIALLPIIIPALIIIWYVRKRIIRNKKSKINSTQANTEKRD